MDLVMDGLDKTELLFVCLALGLVLRVFRKLHVAPRVANV